MKHEIILSDGGIWKVNDKVYEQLSHDERIFLNDFFIEQKVNDFKIRK